METNELKVKLFDLINEQSDLQERYKKIDEEKVALLKELKEKNG